MEELLNIVSNFRGYKYHSRHNNVTKIGLAMTSQVAKNEYIEFADLTTEELANIFTYIYKAFIDSGDADWRNLFHRMVAENEYYYQKTGFNRELFFDNITAIAFHFKFDIKQPKPQFMNNVLIDMSTEKQYDLRLENSFFLRNNFNTENISNEELEERILSEYNPPHYFHQEAQNQIQLARDEQHEIDVENMLHDMSQYKGHGIVDEGLSLFRKTKLIKNNHLNLIKKHYAS